MSQYLICRTEGNTTGELKRCSFGQCLIYMIDRYEITRQGKSDPNLNLDGNEYRSLVVEKEI